MILTIYLIGFFITLTFFKYFGKTIGFDYDSEKTYANYDDWNSNAEAFFIFSIGWFIIIPILLIMGTYVVLTNFVKWYLNK